jgi:hypothetical protein
VGEKGKAKGNDLEQPLFFRLFPFSPWIDRGKDSVGRIAIHGNIFYLA